MEVIVEFCQSRKFINRGFLVGPVCPIYGVGCLSIIFLLKRYENDVLVLFVMSLFLCSMIEYLTSYIMEKLFKARWWDYSNRKFNVNGRICLTYCFAFGVLGVGVMHYVNPFIVKVLKLLSVRLMYIVTGILASLFLVDNCVSFQIISSFRNTAKSIHKDSTEEITKRVRTLLLKRGGLYKRLVSAFHFQASENLLKGIQTKIKKTISNLGESTKKVISKKR